MKTNGSDQEMAIQPTQPMGDLATAGLVPSTLTDLAVRKGEALEIIQARVQILATVRKAALRATNPEDWVMYRAPDGSEVGYLQDCGCDRVRDLFGIEIFNVSQPERISAGDSFMYVLRGDGRCHLTKQTVEAIEGGRSSTDDFVSAERAKALTPAQIELTVRKAARANLDGNITRELSGLKSVPINELAEAWAGTGKDVKRCHAGRGYKDKTGKTYQVGDSVGIHAANAGDYSSDPPPPCPKCGGDTSFVRAGKTKTGRHYPAFWGCKDRKCGGGVKAEEWHATVSQMQPQAEPTDEMAQREPGWEG